MLGVSDLVAGGEAVADAAGFAGDQGGRGVGVLREVFQQHHELVAAQPRHGVGFAHGVLQPLRDQRQQLVAGVVAAGVVELLEVVEVDEQQRAAQALALAGLQRMLQPVQQQPAVRQVGQGVVVGEADDGLLGALALGDVLHHADVVADRTVLVLDRGDAQELGVELAALAAVPQLTAPDAHRGQLRPHRAIELGALLAGAHQIALPAADGLLAAVAGDLAVGAVHLLDDRMGVGDDDGIGGFERHRGDALLVQQAHLCGQVIGDDDDAANLAALVLPGLDGPAQPLALAVAALPQVHVALQVLAGQAAGMQLAPALRQVRQQRVVRGANQLGAGQAKAGAPALARHQVAHVAVEHRHADGRLFDEGAQLGATLGQQALLPAALGDVAGNAEHADALAARVAHQPLGGQEDRIRLARQAQLLFAGAGLAGGEDRQIDLAQHARLLGREQVGVGASQQVLDAEADHARALRIAHQIAAFGVLDEDRVGGAFDDRAQQAAHAPRLALQ